MRSASTPKAFVGDISSGKSLTKVRFASVLQYNDSSRGGSSTDISSKSPMDFLFDLVILAWRRCNEAIYKCMNFAAASTLIANANPISSPGDSTTLKYNYTTHPKHRKCHCQYPATSVFQENALGQQPISRRVRPEHPGHRSEGGLKYNYTTHPKHRKCHCKYPVTPVFQEIA